MFLKVNKSSAAVQEFKFYIFDAFAFSCAKKESSIEYQISLEI